MAICHVSTKYKVLLHPGTVMSEPVITFWQRGLQQVPIAHLISVQNSNEEENDFLLCCCSLGKDIWAAPRAGRRYKGREWLVVEGA